MFCIAETRVARWASTGRRFFPELVSGPFHRGLVIVFIMSAVMALVAALASALRGRRYPATA